MKHIMSMGGITGSSQKERCGSSANSPLHSLRVQPIPFTIAKRLTEGHHYLRSFPGGTKLNFGVFNGKYLKGVVVFGAGPYLAYHLVDGATPEDCLTLTRLWLADELPTNSESYILGIILRSLHLYTDIKFLVSYCDPSVGHIGTIYQASNWLFTGLSSPTPLLDLGDGKTYFSRTLAHKYGSHSLQYFADHKITIKLIPQSPKFRYIYFLDSTWRHRLEIPVLPYPKKEKTDANS
jgi:hypothetical protein